MPYTPTVWENRPSTASPISADNLNKIENGIKAISDVVDTGRLSTGSMSSTYVTASGNQTITGVKTFDTEINIGLAKIVQYPGTTEKLLQIQDALYVGKRFGVSSAGSPRIPVAISPSIDGSTLTAEAPVNKVGIAFNPVFKGGFTNEVGFGALDPRFIFGLNMFVTSGKTVGDLAGINDFWGTLLEIHNYTPNSTLNVLVGATSEANNEGVGSVVQAGYSHRVKGYAARHGETVNAISLHVGSPYTENEGTITGINEALHVGGTAPSYFGGNVSLDNRTLDAGITASAIVRARNIIASDDRTKAQQAAITAYSAGAATVPIIAVGAPSQTADLQRWQDSGGVIKAKVSSNGVGTFALISAGTIDNSDGVGARITQSAATNRALRVMGAVGATADLTAWMNSSNGVLFAVGSDGAPRWAATALEQLTVGPAGAAAAAPATPAKWLKVKDSAGTTYVIPAYAA